MKHDVLYTLSRNTSLEKLLLSLCQQILKSDAFTEIKDLDVHDHMICADFENERLKAMCSQFPAVLSQYQETAEWILQRRTIAQTIYEQIQDKPNAFCLEVRNLLPPLEDLVARKIYRDLYAFPCLRLFYFDRRITVPLSHSMLEFLGLKESEVFQSAQNDSAFFPLHLIRPNGTGELLHLSDTCLFPDYLKKGPFFIRSGTSGWLFPQPKADYYFALVNRSHVLFQPNPISQEEYLYWHHLYLGEGRTDVNATVYQVKEGNIIDSNIGFGYEKSLFRLQNLSDYGERLRNITPKAALTFGNTSYHEFQDLHFMIETD